MKFLIIPLGAALIGTAFAFPPAPHHELYGMARGEDGEPLTGDATIRLVGPSGPVASGLIDTGAGLGVNYSIKVPMDAGTEATLYQSNALMPTQPFTVEVIIDGTSYVPIEAQGTQFTIGVPGGRTRLDLTLGIDSDGDGLPDAWEQEVIAFTNAESLEDVTPDGDSDSDGVSNLIEYLAGTYAFSGLAVFRLDVIEVRDGLAHARFLSVLGRGYSISSSGDLESFDETPFTFNADGSGMRPAYRARRTQFKDIYIPTDGKRVIFFRLHVY